MRSHFQPMCATWVIWIEQYRGQLLRWAPNSGVFNYNVTVRAGCPARLQTDCDGLCGPCRQRLPTTPFMRSVNQSGTATNSIRPQHSSVSASGTTLRFVCILHDRRTGQSGFSPKCKTWAAPTATNSTLAIRLDGQTGISLASVAIPALDPGQLAQMALDLPAGTQPGGEQVYRLTADDGRVVADVNTNNNTTAFSVFLWVDSDGDGIPDSWMMKYFGHPTGLQAIIH